MPIQCDISLVPSVMLTIMSRTSISKTLNFISDIESLTYGFNITYTQDGRHFEVQCFRNFVSLQKKFQRFF